MNTLNRRRLIIIFIIGAFVFSFFALGSIADAERLSPKEKRRKAARIAQEKQEPEGSYKEAAGITYRVDNKIPSERIVDIKLTGQKYLAGVMLREREELKETEAEIRIKEELARGERIRAQRARETAEAERAFERKKKRSRFR